MLDHLGHSRRRRTAVLLGLTTVVVAIVLAVWSSGSAAVWVILALAAAGGTVVALTKAVFELSTRLDSVHAALETQLLEVEAIRRAQADRRGELAAVAERQRNRLEHIAGRVDGVVDKVGYLAGRCDDLTTEAAKLVRASEVSDRQLRSIERSIVVERRARAIDFARQRSGGELPDRLLVQMTVHRSASTQLFDILRAHPSVYVEPLAFVWRELGLDGRRYPSALSDVPRASVPIEVSPGIGTYIRAMQPRDERCLDPSTGAVALEKGHPQFFDFDAAAFGARVDCLVEAHGVDVQILYQVRRPLDVMWSFAEYKARSKNWYAWLDVDQIPAFIARAFDTLAALQSTHSGIVVDFADMSPESATLRRLGRMLDPEISESALEAWLDSAFSHADLEVARRSGFVGSRDPFRQIEGPDGSWRQSVALIESVEATYEKLLSS